MFLVFTQSILEVPPTPVVTTKISLDIVKCVLGSKAAPGREPQNLPLVTEVGGLVMSEVWVITGKGTKDYLFHLMELWKVLGGGYTGAGIGKIHQVGHLGFMYFIILKIYLKMSLHARHNQIGVQFCSFPQGLVFLCVK